MKLLFIEDQERMAQALCEILRQENYDVDHYINGIDGLEAAQSGIYDIIILDIMLPGMNGYEVAKNIRKSAVRTPILMLTAKSDIDDKVEGLDSGADDYLTKPFMTKELLARLRALGRRFSSTADGTLSFGDITLDRGNLTLCCTTNNNSVRLSEKEFKILEYLVMNQNQILTKEQIIAKIWGFNNDAEYNNVEVYMTFTRRKLSFIESKTEIKSIRGIGYELRWRDVQEN